MGETGTEPWRAKVLALDPEPERRGPLYRRLAARGADLEVETDPEAGLSRVAGGRYTLVFVAVTLRERIAGRRTALDTYLEAWAADRAPNYRGRWLYVGDATLLEGALSEGARQRSPSPALLVSDPPTDDELRALEERVGAVLAARPWQDPPERRSGRSR